MLFVGLRSDLAILTAYECLNHLDWTPRCIVNRVWSTQR